MRGKKTYKDDMSFPHTGKTVSRLIKKTGIKQAAIAKELGVSQNTVSTYTKRESSQFGIIWRLSKVFNHNILAEMGERIGIPYETKKEKDLQAEIEALKKENEKLQIVVDTLMKVKG